MLKTLISKELKTQVIHKTYFYIVFFINLIKAARNAKNTQSIFNMAHAMMKLGHFNETIAYLKQDSPSLRYLNERKLMKKYTLDELDQLPEGSLGRIYAQHMLQNNLDPDFYEVLQITDDVAYFIMRIRETHDIWHVITGFGIDVPSELGLQAFTLAQTRSPIGTILIGGAMFKAAFKNLNSVSDIYDQVSKGWLLGRKAKKLFGADWENLWDKPLDQIRHDYNIVL